MAIKAAHRRTRQTCGAERLQRELAEEGIRVGICRIKHIKRKLGLRCKQKRRFKATTDSRHKLPVAENLLKQQFKVYERMPYGPYCIKISSGDIIYRIL